MFWWDEAFDPVELPLIYSAAQRDENSEESVALMPQPNATHHNVRDLFRHPTGYRCDEREVWKLHRFVSDFRGDSEVEKGSDVCGFDLSGADIRLSRKAVCVELHTGMCSRVSLSL